MASTAEIKRLIARSEAERQRCDLALMHGARQCQALAERQSLFNDRHQALSQLLAQHRPQGMMDRAQFFGHQRRLAVIRRKIIELGVELDALARQLTQQHLQQQAIRLQRQRWQQKCEKYQSWHRRQQLAARRRAWQREDAETEEMIAWAASR